MKIELFSNVFLPVNSDPMFDEEFNIGLTSIGSNNRRQFDEEFEEGFRRFSSERREFVPFVIEHRFNIQ